MKTITLHFEDNYAEYVETVMRRKGETIEAYLLGNLEWDSMPDCIGEAPTKSMCYECEYKKSCPDRVKK